MVVGADFGFSSGFRGLFHAGVVAKVHVPPVSLDAGCPPLQSLMPMDAVHSTPIVSPPPPIAGISRRRDDPQIDDPVIRGNPVDMVNLCIRPFAMMDRPDDAMRSKRPGKNRPVPVALEVNLAESFFAGTPGVPLSSYPAKFRWRASVEKMLASILPEKLSSLRIELKYFAKKRGRDFRLCHAATTYTFGPFHSTSGGAKCHC